MSETENELFNALGFSWDRQTIPSSQGARSVENAVARYRQMMTTFVWDAGVLENNPLTYVEVKTLLDGVTIGGQRVSDQEQILNLAESSKKLISMVRDGSFALNKATFTTLHGIVARNEALEWGHFRGEGDEKMTTPNVGLGEHGEYTPLATDHGAKELNRVFERGVQALHDQIPSPFERGAAFFLFGALQQFFFDGNKRTSRHMMNGVLMSSGVDAISIPAAKVQEFNTKMVGFYRHKEATEMMGFLAGCRQEHGLKSLPENGVPKP
jgi:Fic family protein